LPAVKIAAEDQPSPVRKVEVKTTEVLRVGKKTSGTMGVARQATHFVVMFAAGGTMTADPSSPLPKIDRLRLLLTGFPKSCLKVWVTWCAVFFWGSLFEFLGCW